MKKPAAIVLAIVLALSAIIFTQHNKSATPSVQVTLPASDYTVNVFAASSMTGSLTELAKSFEASHAGVHIVFSFGASSTFAQQISNGAPAQIFASASVKAMTDAGTRMVHVQSFMSNRVVVAKPISKYVDIKTAAQILNDPKITWIQCAHEVPCGAAADKALKADGVTTTPKSLEPDVKSVLAKLLAGEVDAAIVYHTDVVAHQELSEILFADPATATTVYQIGEVEGTDPEAAEFIAYLLGPDGQAVFSAAGFDLTVPQ